jgi:hypothetical protein
MRLARHSEAPHVSRRADTRAARAGFPAQLRRCIQSTNVSRRSLSDAAIHTCNCENFGHTDRAMSQCVWPSGPNRPISAKDTDGRQILDWHGACKNCERSRIAVPSEPSRTRWRERQPRRIPRRRRLKTRHFFSHGPTGDKQTALEREFERPGGDYRLTRVDPASSHGQT